MAAAVHVVMWSGVWLYAPCVWLYACVCGCVWLWLYVCLCVAVCAQGGGQRGEVCVEVMILPLCIPPSVFPPLRSLLLSHTRLALVLTPACAHVHVTAITILSHTQNPKPKP